MMIQISGKSTNFGSKMFKKQLIGKGSKFSKVKFWPKPRIQNSANTKPLNLELLTQLACFMFLSRLEKCFEVTEISQKFKCEGDWAKLRGKNLFAQTIMDKIFGTK